MKDPLPPVARKLARDPAGGLTAGGAEAVFTGGVSSPSAPPGVAVSDDGAPDRPYSGSAAAAFWPGWPEIRADLRSSVLLFSALGLIGAPAGVLWWLLAPRLDFRITSTGPVPVVPVPPAELLIADDGVFALGALLVGLLCGAAAWRLRRRRGVATVVALALGTLTGAALAWQVGELLGAGPTRAQLTHVGGQVTTALSLGSLPALALAPFGAVLAYVGAVAFTQRDDLGRLPVPARTTPPVGSPPSVSSPSSV
jgi:hypothetical protein